jgi:hypothetical protein
MGVNVSIIKHDGVVSETILILCSRKTRERTKRKKDRQKKTPKKPNQFLLFVDN